MSNTYTDLTETTFPESVDNLVRMSDLAYDDMTLVSQYYAYLNAGNFTAAKQVLDDNPSLQTKVFNAAKFNKLIDSVIAVQRFFRDDVDEKLNVLQDNLQTEIDNAGNIIDGKVKEFNQDVTNLQASFHSDVNSTVASFEAEVGRFTYCGDYSASVTYQQKNIVSLNGESYICVQSCIDTPPTQGESNEYWSIIAKRGLQGVSGIGLSWCGEYNPESTYQKDDCVAMSNTFYCAKGATTGNPPTDTTYWDRVFEFEYAKKSTVVEATLLASGWSVTDNTYKYTNNLILSEDTVIEMLLSRPDTEQYEAFASAMPVEFEQTAGSVTIKALGDVPTIDIPVKIIFRGDV